jgi:hypothetical protein
MTVYIFAGPSLPVEQVSVGVDAVCLPPVSQGDVYRVALRRPRAIAIIDGYFERVPAVWHKEILWAMEQGIHVYGAASMGALRAAELAQFGMVGVGWVFEQFRDGALEDDDEVAVFHGPAESGYATQSEAMVNIRRTLAAAVQAGIITADSGVALTKIAKSLFYPERSYPLLLQRALVEGLPTDQVTALRAWLPNGRVNQKQLDALALLRTIDADLTRDVGLKQVRYRFEHTIWWDHAQRYAGTTGTNEVDAGGETMLLDGLIDELRLQADGYSHIYERATLRLLAVSEAQRRGYEATPALVQETAERWRRAQRLYEPDDLERWLKANDLTLDRFAVLMGEEALMDRARSAIAGEVTRAVADELRVADTFDRVHARALDKQRRLAAGGLLNPGLEDAGIGREELMSWYFPKLGHAVPADLPGYALNAGFSDEDTLLIAVLREWCYLRLLDEAGECAAPMLQPAIE